MSQALLLREVPARSWADFHLRGLRSRVPQEKEVVERWSRARASGARCELPDAEEHLTRGEPLRLGTERTALVSGVGAPILEQATSLVAPRNYVLLVSDPSGTVTSVSGGGEFTPHARRVRLIEGADWSEASRGTNAIGTAIAEGRPVFVCGTAHYARQFHDLVCYAAPVFDADGTLVAVLDATSRFAMADDAVGQAIVDAARALEQALRARAYATAGLAVTRTLARSLDRMAGAALLVESPGRVARMNVAARVTLRGPAEASVEVALGVTFAALAEEGRAPSPGGLVVSTASGARRARVEPIVAQEGRLLALLVFLEEGGARLRGARPSTPPSLTPAAADPFAPVFAEDPALQRAVAWARRLAPSTLPIMLLAETGGGKELFARAIHAASPRASGPFRAINCGSLSASLLESELFGYGPAAFTGAERRGREGLFAVASGGTLFLDEVAEMPPAMQAALLRVLEDGTYQRVGETTVQRADVRVVCATCRDLDALVAAGAFRKDLYYRLHGARVALPPLRERTDILALARHVLKQLAAASQRVPAPSLSKDVETVLAQHAWPGNVRELRSVLEVALVLAGDALTITRDHLPPELAASPAVPSSSELVSAEGSTVRRVLAEVAGNVSLAASRLGVARSTLYRMMRRHGVRGGD